MATNGTIGQQPVESGSATEPAVSVAPSAGDGTIATTTTTATTTNNNNSNLSKDEVGWYFVQQYYTTLSKCPEKLHLFYSKRSQFVGGRETEVVNVAVGRGGIQDRIKELKFQDCKVRVSNVDSQASFDNILITVIGEMWNNNGTPNRFTQTFILATQPSGYFVLNDILRFLNDDIEDIDGSTDEDAAAAPAQEIPAPVEANPEPEPEKPAEIPAQDPQMFTPAADEKADEPASQEPASQEPASQEPTPVNGGGGAAAPEVAEPIPAAEDVVAPAETVEKPVETAEKPAAETVAQLAASVTREIAEEDAQEPEKPKDPAPTPTVRPAPAPAPEPARPMTWASRVAAASGNSRPAVPKPVTPAVPIPVRVPAPATPPANVPAPAAPATAPAAPTAPTAAAPAAAAAAAAAPQPQGQVQAQAEGQPQAPVAAVAAAAPQAAEPAVPKDGSIPVPSSEWQTAGSESRRHYRPQSISEPGSRDGKLGYVKNVTDRINNDELESELRKFGTLLYFDVNRQKNCAFIEYEAVAEMDSAKAASPMFVGGERIEIEYRRPKSMLGGGGGGYGSPRGPSTRGRGWDSHGSREGGRGGFSRGGRGGAARGGGRGGPPAQAAQV